MTDRSQVNDVESTHELWRWYASAPLLTLGGRPMPCAIYPAPPIQRSDVESVVGECDPSPPGDFVRGDDRLDAILAATRAAGRELYNGTIAAMRRLHIGDRLAIDWSGGWYFDQLATCEGIADEWRRSVGSGGDTPMRREMHGRWGDPIRSGAGRCAGVGVTTVMRIATDDGPCVWLARVSDQKASGAGKLHISPAAMLELTDIQQSTVSVMDTCLREMAEELFGVHADSDVPNRQPWWLDAEPIADLTRLIERGDASVEFAGVSVNLLNLRPEIAVVVRIDTPDWRTRWLDRVRLNWEFTGALREVRFESEQAMASDLGDDLASLVPPAAGSLALALNKLGEPIFE